MSRKTLEEVIEKTGLAAEFEARGIKKVLDLLRNGKSRDKVARIYERELNASEE